MEFTPELEERLKLLMEKYGASNQDIVSYLDGLLYSDYLKYWDYIELDTLLSLQKPRTNFPDEEIFIIYHQITELYFRLCINELKQISGKEECLPSFFLERILRINRYFRALKESFEVMVHGMDQKEFMKFRMALLPASGFQSVQYRWIELMCTPINNLVQKEMRSVFDDQATVSELYQHIYWKQGAIDIQTGNKTLTLQQFEDRYDDELLEGAQGLAGRTIWDQYERLNMTTAEKEEIDPAMRSLDQSINVEWPLAHYKSAVRYLQQKDKSVPATGGTNWQKYLPPRFQKRIFFPQLWSTAEMDNWGKQWVEETLAENAK